MTVEPRQSEIECDGGPACAAPIHLDGCYATQRELGRVVISRAVAEQIDRALTKAITSAIAHYSNEPYPDDPRWTPWTRFGKPIADRSSAARAEIRRAMRDVA